MRNKWRYVLVFIIACLLGYSIGYCKGAYDLLEWSIEKALYFLELKGVQVDINSEEIIRGLTQYKEMIGYGYKELNITELPI